MVSLALTTALLASSLLSVAAQSTSTTSLFLYDLDPQSLVASVVGVANSQTTYAIVCAPGVDSSECGIPAPWSMTYGSTWYEAHTTDPGKFTVSDRCDFQGTTAATCVVSLGGSEANWQGPETSTLEASELSKLPVVITAGLEKLQAATTGGAATTTSAASTKATGSTSSARASSGSSAGSATGSATGTAASASHTNGASSSNLRSGAVVAAMGAVIAYLSS